MSVRAARAVLVLVAALALAIVVGLLVTGDAWALGQFALGVLAGVTIARIVVWTVDAVEALCDQRHTRRG